MTMRIGQGFDAHQFAEGLPLILGGVRIPHDKGIVGHSDGDVLLHALSDALLGAVASGDIGQYFPSDKASINGIDSRKILAVALQQAQQQGYQVANMDATIIAQAPKMSPHILAMREIIAEDLKLSLNDVSIKATTTDFMGFVGRGEGIAVMATVLLSQNCK